MASGIGTIVAALISSTVAAGSAAYQARQQSLESSKARRFARKTAADQTLGNLSSAEAAASGSRRAFRAGLIFTSPTGTQGIGSRGRSRLLGT